MEFPWWAWTVTLAMIELVEDFIEDQIERDLKPELLKTTVLPQELLDSYQSLAYGVQAVSKVNDQVKLLICPR